MTLLEKAMATPIERPKSLSTEHLELAVAWLRGDVTCNQAAAALGCKGNNVYSKLTTVLRVAIRMGVLTMEIKTNAQTI